MQFEHELFPKGPVCKEWIGQIPNAASKPRTEWMTILEFSPEGNIVGDQNARVILKHGNATVGTPIDEARF
ncbi:MAG: hypothetical protein A3F68_04680 [Acidobacteria bacterium RIFCSPLOWO2_12_FULL_54_10]|nr:MAG: hypothetical protein A3F68_04680 [Acidobacteria bacterium RIFCSPLOWO2_12_FULL_54_10]